MEESELDEYLEKTLLYLRDKNDPGKGVVAACVISGDDQVYATSQEKGDQWLHAERNAVNQFKDEYGQLEDDTVVVTTLSPCLEEDVEVRHGRSCTDLLTGEDDTIDGSKIDSVYTGSMDESQLEEGDYGSRGLEVRVTDDDRLGQACRNLHLYFEPENYGQNPPDFVDEALEDL